MHLEQKLTKEKIFEYYANQVPLGHRGSFGIRGFRRSRAGLFRQGHQPPDAAGSGHAGRPDPAAELSPIRSAGRTAPAARRNVVLKVMRENKYITDEEYETAAASPAGAGASTTWSPPTRRISSTW